MALGILACMVIIARYPPQNLEDLFTRLTSIGVDEEQPSSDESTASKEVDTPQGED